MTDIRKSNFIYEYRLRTVTTIRQKRAGEGPPADIEDPSMFTDIATRVGAAYVAAVLVLYGLMLFAA